MRSSYVIFICRFFFPVIIAFLFNSNLPLYSQQITDNQIKIGYLYHFLKYINWEKENQIDTFKVAIYGGDSLMTVLLKSLEKQKVKNKPIRVFSFKTEAEVKVNYCHLLFVANSNNYYVKDISDRIKNNNTLLVTDRYDYTSYIMINFIYNENSKIQFEINAENIENARLKIFPELFAYGGKEPDIRKLYLEIEKSLKSEKEKTVSYERELLSKKKEIQNMNEKILQLSKEIQNDKNEIEVLQQKILNQKNELNKLRNLTNEQQKIIDKENIILFNQKNEIIKQEKQLAEQKIAINTKQQQIEVSSKVLNDQKKEIYEGKIKIEKQEKILFSQNQRIRMQRTFLILLISLTLATIALIFLIYHNYKIKQQKNLQLEQKNYELNNKQNEILFQAEQLERKNIELEKLSIVARETANAIMIMNEKGEFEWMNEGFTRLYGYSLDEFIKNKGHCLRDASVCETIGEIIDTIVREKNTITYETANYNKEGEKIWVHTTLTPILDENKKIRKLIAVDSEITQLKEKELDIIRKNDEIQRQSQVLVKQAEHLLQLNRELESKKNNLEEAITKLKNVQTQLVESEKMVILGQLTAGIAHEINNPVSFINSGIEGIKISINQLIKLLNTYEQITPDNAQKKLKEIKLLKKEMDYSGLLKDIDNLTTDVKTGIFRTIEIIKELRTFSRLDEGDIKLTDLHKNIDSTLVILRNKYFDKIEIVKDYGNIPEIECYPGKINQVFLNILVNAIQAINGEGKITIKTELKKIEEIKYAVISISDTGIGMTEDIKKKIFEPFFTTKNAGEGTGLGLSISSNIIETHNGSIALETQVSKGSTFIIYLPVVFKKKVKKAFDI